jgi:hypothetical protein
MNGGVFLKGGGGITMTDFRRADFRAVARFAQTG